MKKFTSLMLMLLCAVATWAGPTDLPQITTDLENPIYYTIYNTRSKHPGGLMYYAGDEIGLKDGCTSVELEDKYKFYFTGTHDELYVHNAATTKKLASMDSWTEDGTVWAVGVSPKGGGLAFGPKGGLNGSACWNEKNYQTNANTSDFTTWSANDDGSIFVVELAEEYTFPISDLLYTIEAPLFFKVQSVEYGLYVTDGGGLQWGKVDLTNKNFYWSPIVDKENSTVAFKNLGTNKYLNGTNVADEVAKATLKALGSDQFNITINGTTLHTAGHTEGYGTSGNVVSWSGGLNSASAWTFVERNDPDAVKEVMVIYNLQYEGVTKYTQETKTVTEADYPAISVDLPFGVSAVRPEGKISAEDIVVVDGVNTITKNINLTISLPFKYADSEANIQNWYYIQMHSGKDLERYLQYNAGNYIEWLDVTRTENEEDSYTWAFVGNPFDGLKLVNRAAPADANAVTSAQDSGNPGFGSITDAVAWKIKASRINKDNEHFCFQYPGSSKYMNAQEGKVAFWGDNDQGSTMWVTERDLTMTADLQALIDQVDAAIVAYGEGGTTVGYYTVESVNNLLTVLAAAKVAVADPDRTIVTNKAAMANLNAAVAALKTIQPVAGQLYTIKNAYSSVYMNVSDEAGATTYYGDAALNEAFVFEPAAEDGKFYLYNCKRAKYLSSAPAHAYGQVQFKADNKENAKVVTVANLGVANRVSIVPEGGTTIHHDQYYSTVVGWTGDANSRSAWIIEEVANPEEFAFDVTVGEVGYATLYLGCNVTIPEGVEAYIVKGLQGGHALLTAIEGGVICAKTPVILKKAEGQPAEATKYSFKYASAASNVSDNLLLGTTVNTEIEGNAYVLGVIDEKVGLYKAKTTDGKFKNNAHKAYLYIDGAASSAGYRFDFDGTTGITEVETENANDAVIYDLTGRRVQDMNRAGIYIVNGKKVLVK